MQKLSARAKTFRLAMPPRQPGFSASAEQNEKLKLPSNFLKCFTKYLKSFDIRDRIVNLILCPIL